MSPDKDKALCEKYPKIFRERHGFYQSTNMCWGLECGDGWYDLIDRLCYLLQYDTDKNGYPQAIATQVKEKFGTLRFYTAGHNERQDGMIRFAEHQSGYICDVCGMPGTDNDDGWTRTRCKEHAE
jgi:rubrerythrin